VAGGAMQPLARVDLLAALSAVPGAVGALVSAADAMPPVLARYKGFPSVRDALE